MAKKNDAHVGFDVPSALKERIVDVKLRMNMSMAKVMAKWSEIGLELFEHYGPKMFLPDWRLPPGALEGRSEKKRTAG